MYVFLEQAKPHLNIESSFEQDDQYIASLIEVAEEVVSKDTGINMELSKDSEGNIPPVLRHAILLLVGNYYANREPVAFASSSEVPLSYKHLISLYRDYSK